MGDLRFSIITPTYNEEKDIRNTLEGFVGLSYPNKEVLVVDDSNDSTPEIVKEFESRGVHLVRGTRQGCCEAVNLGIEKATGDVVINADADVILPKDFLERLKAHYDAGADWVLVESRVPDSHSVFSRFVGADHVAGHKNKGHATVYYTEAFSCRRDLALKLGLFGPAQPARFCRDWLLGKRLTEEGYKKVYDYSLVVTHPQPDNFDEFWNTRKARGRFGPLQHYFMNKRPLLPMFIKLLVKDAIFVLRFLLIVPAVKKIMSIVSYSSKGVKDFFPFLYAYFLQELARCIGEWEGFKINMKYARSH